MNASIVKQLAADCGTDLCGIAPVDRFCNTPAGFHPWDVFPNCQSVIVLASRFLVSVLSAKSEVPYTIARNEIQNRMDQLTVKLAYLLEDRGVLAIPTGTLGPDAVGEEAKRITGLISLKHAAVLAGLGKIGKNALLFNDRYGSMLWLSAILVSVQLKGDPIAAYEACPVNCTVCMELCPINTIARASSDQVCCLHDAFRTENDGESRVKCYLCCKACPHVAGIPHAQVIQSRNN